MNIANIARLGVQRNPVSVSELQAAVTQGGWTVLPKTLVELLNLSNGFLTPRGIHLYGTSDLAERNQTFEITEYCEGHLLIGDNSGGKGYLMRLSNDDGFVYSSDLGDLEAIGFQKEANSLQDWIDGLN
jgi:hypothetical protein